MTTLREFNSILSLHDWFYPFSDDHRVWTAGKVAAGKIQSLAKISPLHAELYDQWTHHIRNITALDSLDARLEKQKDFKQKLESFLSLHD